MSQHFPVLIAVVPLAAALLSPLFSYIKRELGKWVVICAIAFSDVNTNIRAAVLRSIAFVFMIIYS